MKARAGATTSEEFVLVKASDWDAGWHLLVKFAPLPLSKQQFPTLNRIDRSFKIVISKKIVVPYELLIEIGWSGARLFGNFSTASSDFTSLKPGD